ncbi:MAG: DUF4432 family protein [Propionivibrio sp.]
MGLRLWEHDYSEQDLEARLGDRRQLADIQLSVLADGPAAGMRIARISTAGGFDVEVFLDRAMDLGQARYRGIPLTWRGPGGPFHAHRGELAERGWVRTFNGGLMSLCGLDNIGPPSRDVVLGSEVGQHGRITCAQAEDVGVHRDPQSGSLRLTGTMLVGSLGGHRLRLERSIETSVAGTGVRLRDRIRNWGGARAPLMVLYHSNFGWPLVAEGATLISPAETVEPRDEPAARGIGEWSSFAAPQAGYAEQVFFHRLKPAPAGGAWVAARIENPGLGVGVELAFDSHTLNRLTQWKLCGYGDYVLGVEPGNSPPIGQAEAEQADGLPFLDPGEEIEFAMEWRCFDLS